MAIGSQNGVEPQILSVGLLPGDRLLLCSDGVHGELADDSIQRLLVGAPAMAGWSLVKRVADLEQRRRHPSRRRKTVTPNAPKQRVRLGPSDLIFRRPDEKGATRGPQPCSKPTASATAASSEKKRVRLGPQRISFFGAPTKKEAAPRGPQPCSKPAPSHSQQVRAESIRSPICKPFLTQRIRLNASTRATLTPSESRSHGLSDKRHHRPHRLLAARDHGCSTSETGIGSQELRQDLDEQPRKSASCMPMRGTCRMPSPAKPAAI